MRVGFDATSLTTAGKGIARFQREFLRASAAHGLVEELDVFVPQQPDESALPAVEGWRYHRVPTRPMVAWEQFRLPRLARGLKLDVVLTASERAALWGPPEVVYLYEHPRHRSKRSREVGTSLRQRLVDSTTQLVFRVAMRRAAVVIAASASTARDLAPLREAPVLHSGIGEEFSPAETPRTHFLHLASDDPRDNSEVVVDAYAAYGEGRPPLVVAGLLDVARPALEARARDAGVSIRWAGFQTMAGLVELYRGAIAYVDPSLYEGFGLQAAEAMACGTPVIASNTTSLPEVVGDAGILLDPNDVAGFAAAMRRVAENSTLATELRTKALARAERFTWEHTARELLAACARAAR